jgi:hypothetical protein
MANRRAFLSTLASAAVAAPVFRTSAIRRLEEASRVAGSRPPSSVAEDETYWLEIQRAFDADRTMVNLNNGGCSPCPTHVLEAMIRDLGTHASHHSIEAAAPLPAARASTRSD